MGFTTDLDNDTLEALDFEYEPPCEVNGCDPKPADYYCVFKCCGFVMLFCERDYQDCMNWGKGGGAYYCGNCDTRGMTGNPFAVVNRVKE